MAAGDDATRIDVTSLVQCGRNVLYFYDRDAGCAVSGVNFSVTLNLKDCIITPVHPPTWGSIRHTYR